MEVSIVISCIIAQFTLGAGFGWWLRHSRGGAPAGNSEQTAEELRRLIEEQRRQAEEINEAMSSLHQLTTAIGKDADEHVGRVQKINADLNRAAVGKDGLELKSAVSNAVSEVNRANELLQQQLLEAEQKLAEQAKTIEKHMAVARTDALTGVLNRRAFDEELQRRLSEYQRYRTPVSLLMIDIDHFKKFNDQHGHLAGDEVLKLVARTLTQAMRDVDLVCRYGGEEFGVIMPGTELHGGGMAAERARAAIEKALLEFEGKALRVTMSGGVTAALPNENAASMIKRADEALYASKKSGRNRASLHDGARIVPNGPEAIDIPAPTIPDEPTTPAVEIAEATDADPLHQLPNKEAFYSDLRRRLEQQRKFRTPVSVLLGSIDRLAEVRRDYGGENSNLVMRAAAQLIQAAAREQDTVARVADDRFAITLPGTNLEKAQQLAEKVRMALEKVTVAIHGKAVQMSISFGAVSSQADDLAETIMECATAAVDAAILAGGNRVVVDHRTSAPTTDAAQNLPASAAALAAASIAAAHAEQASGTEGHQEWEAAEQPAG